MEDIKKLLKNPKIQLAIFTLLAVMMAIGFFGSPDVPVTETPATGADKATLASPAAAATASKFFIATLSPMAAGFAMLPFIISILGIGYSLMGINKQNKEKNIIKVEKRYKVIGHEKSRLDNEYKVEYAKLKVLIKADVSSSDQNNEQNLNKINEFINDSEKKPQTRISRGSEAAITYKELFDLYDGAQDIALKLQKIKAEIKAYEAVEKIDLRGVMSDVETKAQKQMTDSNIASQGVKVQVVSKLAAAKSRTL